MTSFSTTKNPTNITTSTFEAEDITVGTLKSEKSAIIYESRTFASKAI